MQSSRSFLLFVVSGLVCGIFRKQTVASIKTKGFATLVVATLTSIPIITGAQNNNLQPAPWNKDVQYEVIKSNPKGPMPIPGDLVTVRFKGSFDGTVFDDTFKTRDPYYFRSITLQIFFAFCYDHDSHIFDITELV